MDWVEVEGVTIPNTCGVCLTHHEWLTGVPGRGHVAHIQWREGVFTWWVKNNDDDWEYHGLLRGQKLVNDQPEAARVRRQEGLCEACGRPLPHKHEPRPKRKAKIWTLAVPDDAEQGAEVLDVYCEDLAVLMGLDPMSPRLLRYHTLVPVLEWVMQNRAEFLRDYLGDEQPNGQLVG